LIVSEEQRICTGCNFCNAYLQFHCRPKARSTFSSMECHDLPIP